MNIEWELLYKQSTQLIHKLSVENRAFKERNNFLEKENQRLIKRILEYQEINK